MADVDKHQKINRVAGKAGHPESEPLGDASVEDLLRLSSGPLQFVQGAEHWLLHMLNSLPCGIACFDSNENLVFANKRYSAALGVDDLSNLTLRDVSGEDDYPKAMASAQMALSGNTDRRIKNMVHPGGLNMTVQLTYIPSFLSDNTVDGFFVLAENITERIVTEAELRRTSERYESLVNNLPHGIMETDCHGIITYANPAYHRMYDLEPGRLIGNNVGERSYEEDGMVKTSRYLDELILAGVSPGTNFMKRQKKDGTPMDVRVDWDFKRDSAEQICGFVCVVTDITDLLVAQQKSREAYEALERRVEERTKDLLEEIEARKKLELEREEARVKAESANRAKSKFIAASSHEFRTPLNAIVGFSEIFSNEYFGDLGSDKYRESARHLYASSQHMLSLVNVTLDLSAIEAGEFQIDPQTIEIARLFETCREIVEGLAKQKSIEIQIDGGTGAQSVSADEKALSQILINLINNAIKYGDEDGLIRLSATRDDQWIRVTVQDNGPGIAASELRKLTLPFHRVATKNRKIEGAGLGLTIVNSLVDLHGGRLEFESVVGEGTSVHVYLPVK